MHFKTFSEDVCSCTDIVCEECLQAMSALFLGPAFGSYVSYQRWTDSRSWSFVWSVVAAFWSLSKVIYRLRTIHDPLFDSIFRVNLPLRRRLLPD